MRWDTATISSASALVSTAGRPRLPRSQGAKPTRSSISSASAAGMGARAKVTSRESSTSVPPRPNATRLPKVGSRVAPTMTSSPGPAMAWTRTPSSLAPGTRSRADDRTVAQAASTSAAVPRPVTTAPASVLWTTSADSTLRATGKPTSAAAAAAADGEVATRERGMGIP